MVGFVDDCHGSINDFESNYVPVHKLMKRANFDAKLWSNLLNTTGGTLEPSKVKYHITKHNFLPIGDPVLSPVQADYRIEMDAHDGNGLIELQPLEPQTSRKMLGTFKEPEGNNLMAWKHVQTNAMKKATKIFNSSLDTKCVFR